MQQKLYLVKIYQRGLFLGILLREVNTRVSTQVRSISLQITKVILTPLPTSAEWAVEKLIQLWSAAKAEVICMDVAKHDEVLAHTSHLPHLMAFNLVEQLANREDNLDIFRYAAGGFRDFSRIAASDPQMWHDIFFANKTAILNAVDGFEKQLSVLRKLIENEDSHALMGLLGHAQAARQHFNHMLAKNL